VKATFIGGEKDIVQQIIYRSEKIWQAKCPNNICTISYIDAHFKE